MKKLFLILFQLYKMNIRLDEQDIRMPKNMSMNI